MCAVTQENVQLSIYAFYTEQYLAGDPQAEVQSLHNDGSIALQTRSAKYGKVGISHHILST